MIERWHGMPQVFSTAVCVHACVPVPMHTSKSNTIFPVYHHIVANGCHCQLVSKVQLCVWHVAVLPCHWSVLLNLLRNALCFQPPQRRPSRGCLLLHFRWNVTVFYGLGDFRWPPCGQPHAAIRSLTYGFDHCVARASPGSMGADRSPYTYILGVDIRWRLLSYGR